MITYDSTFSNYVRGGSVDEIVWMVDLFRDDETDAVSCLSRDLGDQGGVVFPSYYGVVKSISPIASSVNPYDCSYSVSNVSVSIAGGSLGIYATGIELTDKILINPTANEYRNRTIEIRAWVPGYTATANLPVFFDGIISDYWYDKTNEEWVFEAVAKGEKYHKVIPTTTINRVDYPKAPDSSIGKKIPVVYGVFETPYAIDHATGKDHIYHGPLLDHFNLVPTVCTDISAGVFTAASHACKGAVNAENWILVDDLQTYGRSVQDQAGTDMTASATGPTTYTLPIAAREYYKIACLWLRCLIKGTDHTAASDITNVIDGDYLTGTTLAAGTHFATRTAVNSGILLLPTTPVNADLSVLAYISDFDPGTNFCEVGVYNPVNASYLVLEQFDGTEWALEGIMSGPFGISSGVSGDLIRTTPEGGARADDAQWDWDEIGTYEYEVRVAADEELVLNWFGILVKDALLTVPPTKPIVKRSVDSYHLEMRLDTSGRHARMVPVFRYKYSLDRPMGMFKTPNGEAISQVFVELTGGRMFGSWIDGASRSNSFDEDDTIVDSNFIAESILRDEMAVPDADIDYASFDAGETAAYHLGFSLNDEISTRELLADIGYNSKSIFYQLENGTWTMYQFPQTPSSSDADLDCTSIKFSSFRWSSPDWLANDVRVYYAWDYGRGKYQRYKNVSNATAAGDTYQGQNMTLTLNVESPYLLWAPYTGAYSTTYAEALATYLCKQWKDPHLIVNFETSDVSQWVVQCGDVVTFQNATSEQNPMGLGGGSATDAMSSFTAPRTKYFLIIGRELDPINGRCKYQAFQLHDLS